MDDDHRYLAVRSGDSRFDGVFYVGVSSTGIYCRPSCPAITPKRRNVRFFPSSAAAHDAGFRACKRCRPDASPGSPEWNVRADIVGRTMRLIADGAVDRDGVAGLATAVGYSERQLHRLLVAELGAGPLALARAQRARTARILVETTDVPFSDIAFAAGFASIRQFNDTVREVYARTPTELRQRSTHREGDAHPGGLALRLPYRPPMELDHVLAFLGARAVPGVEELTGDTYRRILRLPHGTGVVEIRRGANDDHLHCRLSLDDLRDLGAAVQRCRRLLDLDSDPRAVADVLGGDGVLGQLVADMPGLRSPGHVDPAELAVRAVLGQQVSVAAARTVAGRLGERYGKPLAAPSGTLTHAFPTAETLAGASMDDLPMPAGRARALIGICEAIASGDIDLGPGADRDACESRMRLLPGIGPWTAGYIRMRALGDPDVFLASDLGTRQALTHLGHPGDAASAERAARAWSPWRSYANHYLWATLAQHPDR